MLPRVSGIDVGRDEGKTTTRSVVRGASRTGAIVTARLDAARTIPLRDQEVILVEAKSNGRLFDQWEVKIRDKDTSR